MRHTNANKPKQYNHVVAKTTSPQRQFPFCETKNNERSDCRKIKLIPVSKVTDFRFNIITGNKKKKNTADNILQVSIVIKKLAIKIYKQGRKR